MKEKLKDFLKSHFKNRPDRMCFYAGLIIILISLILPDFIVRLFPTMKPVGYVTLYLAPALGVLGVIISIYNRAYILMFLNFMLMFSFFILMSLGYNINL